MITSGMTYKEMYDHLAADLKKVQYRQKYFQPKAIKEFRKTRIFPAWKWYPYTVPETNNKYVIFFYADNLNCVEKPKVDFFSDILLDNNRLFVKWGASGYRHTSNSPLKAIRIINAYTIHFLHRYKERFLKDDSLSVIDIACRYFSRNEIAMPIEINESINKNIEKYGEEAKQGFRVRDGVCFTYTKIEGEFHNDVNTDDDRVDAMYIKYRTFLSEYKMAEEQQIAIEKEHWEKWTEAFMAFAKEAKNGVLTLRLEP